MEACLVAGNGGDGLAHHGHDRRDLHALFGGSIPGVSRGAPCRLEARPGERIEDVRRGAGLGLRAAPLDRRDDFGQGSGVAGREHIGQRPERLGERTPEDVRLRCVVGCLAGFPDFQGDEIGTHS